MILSTAPQLSISQKALGTLPEVDNIMPKRVGGTINNYLTEWIIGVFRCFLTHIFTGILIFKGPKTRRFYKSLGVKVLILIVRKEFKWTRYRLIKIYLQWELGYCATEIIFRLLNSETFSKCRSHNDKCASLYSNRFVVELQLCE
jgi:hypothetical protein